MIQFHDSHDFTVLTSQRREAIQPTILSLCVNMLLDDAKASMLQHERYKSPAFFPHCIHPRSRRIFIHSCAKISAVGVYRSSIPSSIPRLPLYIRVSRDGHTHKTNLWLPACGVQPSILLWFNMQVLVRSTLMYSLKRVENYIKEKHLSTLKVSGNDLDKH